jgi:hypothetical protein
MVRDEGKEPWAKVVSKMKIKETEYLWFTGSDDSLVFPWYDHERITLKDPPKSSTEPVEEEDDESGGPSFGPDVQGPLGPKPPGPSGPKPSTGSSSSSPDQTVPSDGGPQPFTAPAFNVSTERSGGKVDIAFRCPGREFHTNVDSKIKEKDIQRLVANSL